MGESTNRFNGKWRVITTSRPSRYFKTLEAAAEYRDLLLLRGEKEIYMEDPNGNSIAPPENEFEARISDLEDMIRELWNNEAEIQDWTHVDGNAEKAIEARKEVYREFFADDLPSELEDADTAGWLEEDDGGNE